MVNHEIWKMLDKRTQTQDKGIQDIQNLVATGITPIIKLTEILKPQIMANSLKQRHYCQIHSHYLDKFSSICRSDGDISLAQI